MKAAKEMDYKPNHMAGCLAKGSTKTIGVVCAGMSYGFDNIPILDSIGIASAD